MKKAFLKSKFLSLLKINKKKEEKILYPTIITWVSPASLWIDEQ